MSVVPILSKNTVAYLVGHRIGDFSARPVLNRIRQHLDSCSTSTRATLERFVPLVGVGIVTLAAYSIYPRSKALTPANLCLQGIVSGVHSLAMDYFLNQSMGGVYTLQAQIRKYLGPSYWINRQKEAESELSLIQEWKFCEQLNPDIKKCLVHHLTTQIGEEQIDIGHFKTEDPKEKARIQSTLDTFKKKTPKEQESIAFTLRKYYSTTPAESHKNRQQLETELTAEHTVYKIVKGVAMIIPDAFRDRLMGPSVPIALTDRCCALFLPFYLIRKVVPAIGFTCNKNIIFYNAALDSIKAIARSLLEYLPPESSDEHH